MATSMPPAKVKSTLDTISANFDRLRKKMDQIPDTLLDLTHERVDALGEKKKKQMIVDAFGETKTFVKQFGESRRRVRK
jgi:hypothetical protein